MLEPIFFPAGLCRLGRELEGLPKRRLQFEDVVVTLLFNTEKKTTKNGYDSLMNFSQSGIQKTVELDNPATGSDQNYKLFTTNR